MSVNHKPEKASESAKLVNSDVKKSDRGRNLASEIVKLVKSDAKRE